MKRIHLIISGGVQGVGYRAFVARLAQKNQILGWVRNTEDGSVEVVAEAEVPVLKEFINACYKGSPIAHVNTVKEQWGAATGDYAGFSVVY
jgi:acylphosphatase